MKSLQMRIARGLLLSCAIITAFMMLDVVVEADPAFRCKTNGNEKWKLLSF